MNRQHIISEIKRTAENNGGKPLGVARFFSETGIKDSDWIGKYWLRWGDALKEAGYAPNEFQAAFTDDEMFGKITLLIRELGHFPIKAELIMKARIDPDFPSHNTFKRFGGNKKQLISKVLEIARSKIGYEDVIEICLQELAESDVAKIDSLDESNDQISLGVVYLMKSGRYYKIGHSRAAGRREYELGIKLPEEIKIIHEIKTDDPPGIEQYWHKRFADKRKGGEWFDLSSEDVKTFKRRKFM